LCDLNDEGKWPGTQGVDDVVFVEGDITGEVKDIRSSSWDAGIDELSLEGVCREFLAESCEGMFPVHRLEQRG
jgi:hypothetical protein